MAPEHCSGSTLDRRADVYSMGVTLHELLTGTRLYPESNPLLVVRRITQEDVQPPSTLNPAVPAALDELVMAATARLLRQRIPDAKTLADRLDAWLFKRKDRPTPESLAAWLENAAAEILPAPLPAAPAQDSPPPPSLIRGRPNEGPSSGVTNPWEDVNLSTSPGPQPAPPPARPSGGFTPPPGGGDQGVTGLLPRTVVERTTARTGTDGRGWEPDSQNRPVVMGQVVLELAPPVPTPRPLPAPRTPAPRLAARDWRTEPTQPEVPATPKLVPPPVTMPPVAEAPPQAPTLVSPALALATGFRSELNQMFADAAAVREQAAAPVAPTRLVATRSQKPRSWRRNGTNPFLKKVPTDERSQTQAFYERIFSAFVASGSIQGGQQMYVSHGQHEAPLNVPGAQPAPGQWVPFVHLPSLEPVLLLVPQLGGKVVQGMTPSAAGVFALIQDPSGGTLGLFSAAPSR
jgi:predicted enzyme related to lactoylglutathione lyase